MTADGGTGTNAADGAGSNVTVLNDSGTIEVNDISSLGATGGTVQLSASGDIDQQNPSDIQAANLKIVSGGDVTLEETTNDVDVLAADLTSGTGDISYVDDDDLEIGSVASVTSLGQTIGQVDGITTKGGSVPGPTLSLNDLLLPLHAVNSFFAP